ncbi:MAG TPA: Lin1244/Lin1753 domain-containing protein [Sedimentibacter sp.]|nr:Lin1244/Lin1753 domain-containing protein [Sedimentibacter sp.]
MARPIKQGLDYFPFDVDFFQDLKIRKIIRSNGQCSPAVLICVLALIYKENGYYINWDEDTAFVVSEMLNSDEETISLVVSKAIEVDFFNKEVFSKFSILTSRAIQKNWIKHTQFVPISFLDYEINLLGNIKIAKYKHSEKIRMYNHNVKQWYKIIKEVFKRDNYTCQYCGQIGGKLEADHIIPFSKGGSDETSNLITSCRKCNRQKKDKSANEFIKWRESRYEKN